MREPIHVSIYIHDGNKSLLKKIMKSVLKLKQKFSLTLVCKLAYRQPSLERDLGIRISIILFGVIPSCLAIWICRILLNNIIINYETYARGTPILLTLTTAIAITILVAVSGWRWVFQGRHQLTRDVKRVDKCYRYVISHGVTIPAEVINVRNLEDKGQLENRPIRELTYKFKTTNGEIRYDYYKLFQHSDTIPTEATILYAAYKEDRS